MVAKASKSLSVSGSPASPWSTNVMTARTAITLGTSSEGLRRRIAHATARSPPSSTGHVTIAANWWPST